MEAMLLPIVFAIAMAAIGFIAVILMVSIFFPHRRLWPVGKATFANQVMIWVPTIAVFGGVIALGLLDWNGLGWSAWFRWSVGLPLIVAGNLVVSDGVLKIGPRATSGEVATLRTDGLYRYSRNPQYVADMVILSGWAILFASAWVWPVAIGGMTVLALAPFAEEPWLSDQYGELYAAYRERTSRFVRLPRLGSTTSAS